MSTPARRRTNMRDSMENVYKTLGGDEEMIAWVRASELNRRIFYRDIVPKLVPREVNNRHTDPDGGPVKHVFVWEGGPMDPAKATEKALEIDVTPEATEKIDE